MTNRFPLIINDINSQIEELPYGDNLDLSNSDISNVGNIVVATNVTVNSYDVGTKVIPQVIKTSNYTLQLTDSGKHILHPSSDTSARTFTIPANSSVPFDIGTAITIVNQDSAGNVTISITSDTMRLAGEGTTGSQILNPNGIATIIKLTDTEWLISGVGFQ